MTFIYCLDEALADKLKLFGAQLLKEGIIDNKKVWIYTKPLKMQFNKEDKNKYFLSNKLTF